MRSKRKNLTPGATGWPGLVMLALCLLPFITLLGSQRLRRKMTTTTKSGYDLYALLTEAGFNDRYSRFIVAQAAHESNNFDSLIFKINNNPFGIKYMNQETAEGEKNGYAYYKHVGQAVQDYKRIFKSYGLVSLSTLESFVKLLKDRSYFEATTEEYLRGCRWFYNLYFPNTWQIPVKGPSGSW